MFVFALGNMSEHYGLHPPILFWAMEAHFHSLFESSREKLTYRSQAERKRRTGRENLKDWAIESILIFYLYFFILGA